LGQQHRGFVVSGRLWFRENGGAEPTSNAPDLPATVRCDAELAPRSNEVVDLASRGGVKRQQWQPIMLVKYPALCPHGVRQGSASSACRRSIAGTMFGLHLITRRGQSGYDPVLQTSGRLNARQRGSVFQAECPVRANGCRSPMVASMGSPRRSPKHRNVGQLRLQMGSHQFQTA
jgi:hypothetical protein